MREELFFEDCQILFRVLDHFFSLIAFLTHVHQSFGNFRSTFFAFSESLVKSAMLKYNYVIEQP